MSQARPPLITCSRRLEWDSMHRVPGHEGACKAFHGHRYVATVTCAGDVGTSGMIIDFGVVKRMVGGWIDAHWDHTAILWRDDCDPATDAIVASNRAYGKPVYLMAQPPTAENIAAELASVATRLLDDSGITVTRIEVAETPNSFATWQRTSEPAARDEEAQLQQQRTEVIRMGYHSDELPLASDFQPLEGEANFGPPLTREVVGGAHIAPHCIAIQDKQFVLADWADGLPRHDAPGSRAIRFPHGLMMFGESFEDSARRLVADQLGMELETARVIHVYSYVDDMEHWHMEPLILTEVSGDASPPSGVTIVRCDAGPNLPEGTSWRGKPPFEQAFEKFIRPQLRLLGQTAAA